MDYKIIYSKRRTIAIQITKECEIVVRAPRGIGKEKVSSFVALNEKWILSHLEVQRRRMLAHPEPSEDELLRLTEAAKRILPERVGYFSKIMGVSPEHVSINRARTKFGSCSSKKRINFSCRLMSYPSEAVDYVVVHELAHLKYLNHSKDFWAFVEKFMPDYKKRKALLKS